jgi:hypothetical protein
MAGIGIAKEVSGPLASVLAFGGFTAWWLLSCNKEEAQNDLGHQVTKHVFNGLTIIDNIGLQVSNLLNRSDEQKNCKNDIKQDDIVECESNDGSISPSNSQMASQCSFDETADSESTGAGNYIRQSSLNEESLTDAVNYSETTLSREKPTDILVEMAETSKFCITDSEQRDQLIEAIMLGDEAYVASALCGIDPESLEDHGMDEFGNSLLILAVQVAHLGFLRPADPP